jgi:hypothetical protein
LLIFGEYGAIGFVISAKSIIRFPEINKQDEGDKKLPDKKAEYYLIGTLLSMVSTFLVATLLGLISS